MNRGDVSLTGWKLQEPSFKMDAYDKFDHIATTIGIERQFIEFSSEEIVLNSLFWKPGVSLSIMSIGMYRAFYASQGC